MVKLLGKAVGVAGFNASKLRFEFVGSRLGPVDPGSYSGLPMAFPWG